MKPVSLKARLDRLGLKQTEFARLVDVSARTVSLWATGETPLPGPVAAYLRVLELLPTQAREQEFARAGRTDEMLTEGLYHLTYASPDTKAFGSATVVMRGGRILGTDVAGGLIEGTYEYDDASQLNRVGITLAVPADGVLVTGTHAGPLGMRIPIVASFRKPSPTATTTVDVLGQAVAVEIRFVGSLPS